jgi:hypothetical protein
MKIELGRLRIDIAAWFVVLLIAVVVVVALRCFGALDMSAEFHLRRAEAVDVVR